MSFVALGVGVAGLGVSVFSAISSKNAQKKALALQAQTQQLSAEQNMAISQQALAAKTETDKMNILQSNVASIYTGGVTQAASGTADSKLAITVIGGAALLFGVAYLTQNQQ